MNPHPPSPGSMRLIVVFSPHSAACSGTMLSYGRTLSASKLKLSCSGSIARTFASGYLFANRIDASPMVRPSVHDDAGSLDGSKVVLVVEEHLHVRRYVRRRHAQPERGFHAGRLN